MLSKNINKQSKTTFVKKKKKKKKKLLFCYKIKCYCLGSLGTPKISSVGTNEDNQRVKLHIGILLLDYNIHKKPVVYWL